MDSALTTLEQQVQPGHTAVLVVDMQNDFCAEGGYLQRKYGVDTAASAPLAANIMALVQAARDGGALVVWIKAIYDEDLISAAHRARSRALGGGETVCASDSWGADFYAGVQPLPDEPVINKHRYSAFHGTDLAARLDERGIKTLILTGVSTNVCVDSTLRDGFFAGYHVVLPEDCVSAGDDQLQAATLATVAGNFGFVSRCASFPQYPQRSKSPVHPASPVAILGPLRPSRRRESSHKDLKGGRNA